MMCSNMIHTRHKYILIYNPNSNKQFSFGKPAKGLVDKRRRLLDNTPFWYCVLSGRVREVGTVIKKKKGKEREGKYENEKMSVYIMNIGQVERVMKIA